MDPKDVLLNHLKSESEPMSLSELMLSLGSDFKERTVRRWLAELCKKKVVLKVGERRGTKYFRNENIDSMNPDTSGSSCFFSKESLEVIEKIRSPLFHREPISYNDDWIDNYKPNRDFYLPSVIREKLFESGSRASKYDPAGTYAHKIFNRLLIDLSYNSSRLEGNTYSLLDTERLLMRGDSPEGKLDAEKIMILNHKEAILYLVEGISKLDFSSQTAFTFHYLLADGLVLPQEAGKVRRHPVRVSGSVYMPYEDREILLRQLDKVMKKASQIMDPFEQSIFLLIHLSYLQAFADVNKRTARLLSNISLVKKNLVPLAFNDIQVEDYMSSVIAIYEKQDVRPLVDLYVHSYLRTCTLYDKTAHAMGFDEIRVKYRSLRREIIRRIITNLITGISLISYIESESKKAVSASDVNDFIKDVHEDLELIDEARIAGLGITAGELKMWVKKNQSDKSAL